MLNLYSYNYTSCCALNDRGVGVFLPARSRISSPPSRQGRPRIDWVAETLSPEVKRPGHEAEADRSSPTSVEAEETQIHSTSTPTQVVME
jgi:hypothetical protein